MGTHVCVHDLLRADVKAFCDCVHDLLTIKHCILVISHIMLFMLDPGL
jgi:hypothetical protein